MLAPPLDRRLSIAPMMDWTDRFFRTFIRVITKHTLLYTEMVTTGALLHGDYARFLRFDPCEHPIALQLGGSNPTQLATCAKLGEQWGYDEINLNLGCPSERVHEGRFGACLMAEPALVADCVCAMQEAVNIPVTLKHRIGINEWDDYTQLHHFMRMLATTGCEVSIVHARKAILGKLSPKENRTIPPLRYDFVHRLKQDFPKMQIVLNGGITNLEQVITQLSCVDGVMIGRAAYQNPWILAKADQQIFGTDCDPISRFAVIEAYLPQIAIALETGVSLHSITRHMLGLFHGIAGANAWRRYLSENSQRIGAGVEVINDAVEQIKNNVSMRNC